VKILASVVFPEMSDLKKGLTAFYSQDYTTAFSLLKPLADKGNAEAQCVIANIHHLGLGVENLLN
jgi:TPR repeat protein